MRNSLKSFYLKLPVFRELNRIMLAVRISESLEKRKLETLQHLAADIAYSNHPHSRDEKRLLKSSWQVNSQSCEDGIIDEIFRRIGTRNRFFAEVGIGDGSENNTAFLLTQGWSGAWVDGDPSFQSTLARMGQDLKKRIVSKCCFVTRENISFLFQELGIPEEVDLLSLDVDQNTYYLWEGLEGYRPAVVVVEYNASIPAHVEWKAKYNPGQVWDDTICFGASLKSFELLGRSKGYSLVGCDLAGANAFFVRSDLTGHHFCEPYTSENHYCPPRYTLNFTRGHKKALLE